MAVLKQIKFGNVSTPIAMTQVAINENSNKALSVVATNNGVNDDANPVYTIALAVDGKTITKTGNDGLATAVALKYEAPVLYTAEDEEVIGGTKEVGDVKTPARIALVDSDGASGYSVLSSVNVSSIIGDGIVESSEYDSATGVLTISFVGGDNVEINLGELLDIDDIVLANGSEDYLSFELADPEADQGQAVLGVKLADVTYTPTQPATYYTAEDEEVIAGTKEVGDIKTAAVNADLSVNTTGGSLLDAEDAIVAIKRYVDNQSSDLSISAQGDEYVSAAVDANNNKKINVAADVQTLTATAGTVGTYGADGSVTTEPVAGTLSGTANSLVDGADVASKVKTYVDGALAIEAARSDANTLASIQALDYADTAVAGQVVTEVDETNGVIATTRANLSGITLAGFTTDSNASGDIADSDTVAGALNKLQNKVNAVQYQVNGTTLEFFGITEKPAAQQEEPGAGD